MLANTMVFKAVWMFPVCDSIFLCCWGGKDADYEPKDEFEYNYEIPWIILASYSNQSFL